MLRLKGCLLAACLLSPLTQAADLGTWGDSPARKARACMNMQRIPAKPGRVASK